MLRATQPIFCGPGTCSHSFLVLCAVIASHELITIPFQATFRALDNQISQDSLALSRGRRIVDLNK